MRTQPAGHVPFAPRLETAKHADNRDPPTARHGVGRAGQGGEADDINDQVHASIGRLLEAFFSMMLALEEMSARQKNRKLPA